jgi:hypothetical protein
VPLLAVWPEAPELEITKHEMCVECRPVGRPAGFVGVNVRKLPACLADLALLREYGPVLRPVSNRHHAVPGVSLPVKIRRQLRQAPKACLALAQLEPKRIDSSADGGETWQDYRKRMKRTIGTPRKPGPRIQVLRPVRK